jgi:thiol-disulfide isomerase/thioredoxin
MMRRMKGFLFIAFSAFALGSGFSGAVLAESGPPIEGQVQNFEAFPEPLETTDVPVLTKSGGTTTLAQFRGKFVVLNFWATWCGPCIRELPSLERLNAALPDDRAQVVLISQDRGGFKQTERFLRKLEVSFPDNFVDERLKFSRAIGVVSLPTTILIAPDGKEIGRLVGTAEWDSPEALALVNWYLDREMAAMEKSGS